MRIGMIDCQAIRKRWEAVGSKLDERGRRVFAAGEVRAAGWGGLEAVSEITGLARSTIGRGLKDLVPSRRWLELGWRSLRVFNPNDSGVDAPERRPRHDEGYHEGGGCGC